MTATFLSRGKERPVTRPGAIGHPNGAWRDEKEKDVAAEMLLRMVAAIAHSCRPSSGRLEETSTGAVPKAAAEFVYLTAAERATAGSTGRIRT